MILFTPKNQIQLNKPNKDKNTWITNLNIKDLNNRN